jgi:hypothetical protein
MSYTKTWTIAFDTVPTDQTSLTLQCASFLTQFKDFLVSVGWSVEQSCDSTQYGAADYWTSLSALVWASSGVHSWIVLKSPVGLVAGANGSYAGDQSRLWLSIDLLVTSALTYTATFGLHRVQPTTGPASTSVCPTSDTQFGWTNQQFLRSSLTATAKWHFEACSTGEFWAFTGYTSAGYLSFAFGLYPVSDVEKNTVTNNDYPYAVGAYAYWRDALVGALTNVQLGTAWQGGASIVGAMGPWSDSVIKGWAYDGSVATMKLLSVSGSEGWWNGGLGSIQSICQVGQYFPATGDHWNGRQITSPMYLICKTTGKTAFIGKVADIEMCNQGAAQGSVDSVGMPTMTVIGHYWMPTNTVMAL